MDELEANGVLKFDFGGQEVLLTKDDLLIEMIKKPGYVTENNGEVTVVLDCNLTDELLQEGFVREVISKIQTMRKEADFEVTDHITVYHKGNAKIAAVFETYGEQIMSEVLADAVIAGELNGYTKEWNINGETVAFGVLR